MKYVAAILIMFVSLTVFAQEGDKGHRNPAVRRAFLKAHGLCVTLKPAPGKPARVSCLTPKHCQVDHRISLMCGGPDVVENLRLYCDDEMREKEIVERKCGTPEYADWLSHHP